MNLIGWTMLAVWVAFCGWCLWALVGEVAASMTRRRGRSNRSDASPSRRKEPS